MAPSSPPPPHATNTAAPRSRKGMTAALRHASADDFAVPLTDTRPPSSELVLRSSACAQQHRHPVARPERQDGVGLDGATGDSPQAKSTRDHGEYELPLHHGELASNAAPRAAAEREICKLGAL